MAVLLVMVQAPPIALAKSPTQTELATISNQLDSGAISAEESGLLPIIPSWSLRFLLRNTQIEQILSQDAALVFAYNYSYAYFVVTVDISTGRHPWESSLIPFGNPPVTVLDVRDIPILEDSTLVGKLLVFQQPQSNLTEVIFDWFERVPFKINSIWGMRNVQISLWSSCYNLARSGLISNETDFTGVEKWNLFLSQNIANYWQPIKTSSQIATIISQNGNRLLLIAGVSLAGAVTLYALERRTRRKANAAAYEKLSAPDKKIIDTLRQTEVATTPTLNAITAKYLSATGKNIDKENLLRKLSEAEKMGLIKSCLVSKQDEPVQIWKTQFPMRAQLDS